MNTPSIPKQAVIYCRVSTKEQVEEGNSLKTQERLCKEYAIKNGYTVVRVFIEQGESAKTADRTELQNMLAFCAHHRKLVSAVIIYKLDRLSRNTDAYSEIRLLLKKYEIEIKSTTEYFENTPVGKFLENTMANIAQFDNDIRAERCAGGMKEAVREGRYVWMAPVGYDNVKVADKSTIAINPVLGPLIRETFEHIALRRFPIEEIRHMMAKKGLTLKSGRPISQAYFYELIKNELYSGWITKFGERHKGHFEPIITEEIFNQVQRAIRNQGNNKPHITDHPDFPLRRFIIDGNGQKVTGSWSKGRYRKYPYYRFGRVGSNYNKDRFEEKFVAYMNQYSLTSIDFELLKGYVKKHLSEAVKDEIKHTEHVKQRIADLGDKQGVLIKKNIDGVISDAVLKQQLALLEEASLNLHTELLTLSTKNTVDYTRVLQIVEEYVKNPGNIWVKAKIDKKLKLQWFQFPLGIEFRNSTFGTREVASIFKAKHPISDSNSAVVDYKLKNLNQHGELYQKEQAGAIGEELTKLFYILSEQPELEYPS